MMESLPRILMIEDQAKFRRAFVSMLKSLGIATVHEASNGEEAAEAFLSNAVDFILCEWQMPQTSGMDILREVRSNPLTVNLPFLMVCGVGQLEEGDYAEMKELDADGHIFKPLNQQELESTIGATIANHNSFLEAIVHLMRAGAFVDIDAYDEARAELKIAQTKKPDFARTWSESGLVFEEMEDMDDARTCYRKAVEIDDHYTKAYDRLGGLSLKDGNPQEAIEFFERAAQINPKNKDRQFALANALVSTGDIENARIALHRAVEEESDPAAKNALAAEFFLSAGRADLAEEEYAFALEVDPSNVHYYNRMGIALRHQKKYKEAIHNFQMALKISPEDEVLYYNLSRAFIEAGQQKTAKAALRRALMLNPGFTQAEELLRKMGA